LTADLVAVERPSAHRRHPEETIMRASKRAVFWLAGTVLLAASPPSARTSRNSRSIGQEFAPDGTFIHGSGFPDPKPWLANEHGIFVDRAGSVWLAGNANDDSAIHWSSREGKHLPTIGVDGPTGGSNDTRPVRPPRRPLPLDPCPRGRFQGQRLYRPDRHREARPELTPTAPPK
jgi:hypothetical protein